MMAYLFLQNPYMTMFQLLFIRSVCSCTITFILLGVDIKRHMYDNISGPDLKKVLFRITMFGISMPMLILGLKYFPPSLSRAASVLIQAVYSAVLGYFFVGD